MDGMFSFQLGSDRCCGGCYSIWLLFHIDIYTFSRTVVVVAVIPYGVVQLGSLNNISEDLEKVNHIRDYIFSCQDSSVVFIPKYEPCPVRSSSCLEDETINKDGRHELLASGVDESTILLQSRCEVLLLEQQKQRQAGLHSDRECEGETSGLESPGMGSVDLHDSAARNNQIATCIPEPFGMQILRDVQNMVFKTESYKMELVDMPFKFSAGCELYEVLGPVFQKQRRYCDWEAEKTETETAVGMPENIVSSSLLMADSGSEQLLEARVAHVCSCVTDVKFEKSVSESMKFQLTTEHMPNPTCDMRTVGSAGYPFHRSFVEKEALCLSSEACIVSSSKGFFSRSHGTFRGQFDNAQDPSKINKKRAGARPGESFGPKPRDRQLIQDRIKELRDLVPNGSKCSIDSLLEQTIKHILFMESITKHAEKLNKCTKSKLHDKEAVVQALTSYDQGSTWAVEVGSLVKVCPIMVENLNKNGQMLIEMLSDECSHFLEIAEAIRSLGLMILTGVTEACGKKILICFVVELQGKNRSMHRVDILWALVQILQSKMTI